MISNISCVKTNLKSRNIDSMIVLGESNIYFLSSLDCPGILIITEEENVFLTYDKYVAYAKGIIKIADQINVETLNDIQDIVKYFQNSNRIGIEAKYMSLADYNLTSKILDSEMVDVSGIIENLREIKDEEQITIMKDISEILVSIMKKVKFKLQKGVSEYEITEYIKNSIRNYTLEALDIEVHFGRNTSSRLKSYTNYKLRENDIVTISIAARKRGYTSRIGRTFFKGDFLDTNSDVKKEYEKLVKVHDLMLRTIKSGEIVGDISKDIVEELKNTLWNTYYDVGSGIGIEVIEDPILNTHSKKKFKENMTLLITPSVFLENTYGIIIEDVIVLTAVNYIMLTKSPREIEELIIK